MRSASLAIALGAVALSSPAALANTQSVATCAPIDEARVEALFNRWNDAAKTGKADAVASNYFADAVLLPTVQNKPATNTAEITAYFEKLLKKQPVAEVNSRTVKIGCNKVTDAGTWTFTLNGDDGKPTKVPARYTFIYEHRDGEWKISHHHSSMMPEKVQ